MKSLNQCNFIGNLGKDPEVRYTNNGTAVATVSIACTEKWKDGEHTEWVPLVFWSKLADIAGQYLKKGDAIYVTASARTRSWQSDSGETKYKTEYRVNDLVMLGGKSQGSQQSQAPEPQQDSSGGGDWDEIPF